MRIFYRVHIYCNGVFVISVQNSAPRAGIEPVSHSFRDSVSTISPSRLPDITTPSCLWGSMTESSVQTTTLSLQMTPCSIDTLFSEHI